MELELTHAYNAGLDKVLGAFLSEGHIQEKNQRLGSRNLRIAELRRDDESAKLVVERELSASSEVPGILASFHKPWNRVRQEEHWFRKDDAEWHCEFRVRIDGVPAKIKGMMRLQGNVEKSINYVTLTVKCDVPFLGSKIAKFLAKDSHAKIENEYQVTRELL
ncbi:DUF2505 domain-containing protein [Marinobacter sp. CHS3-4]|uniref:DUF2505 domain-containing protein n=1 Tax=Marinobacter sp. CHS3-4 TaxID=3045174 RepID=UPI0024B4C7BE|nr:DUF2505 domain-containing protein [Marinobacter sp. CHS3-4]MDI9244533.1 DUF2505 domain-containing protein [Marinobacter sp. CHS3-4]